MFKALLFSRQDGKYLHGKAVNFMISRAFMLSRDIVKQGIIKFHVAKPLEHVIDLLMKLVVQVAFPFPPSGPLIAQASKVLVAY